MLKIKSFLTPELKSQNILEICKLKNTLWKFGINSNHKWFKKNISKRDMHILVFLKKKLIGYTCLREKFFIDNFKKKKFLYFDTIIIEKKFRNKNYSKKLMKFNNRLIRNSKKPSFLLCLKKMIKLYNKYNWKVINKKKFSLKNHKTKNKIGMIYNLKKPQKK